jgi:hypothetical protein
MRLPTSPAFAIPAGVDAIASKELPFVLSALEHGDPFCQRAAPYTHRSPEVQGGGQADSLADPLYMFALQADTTRMVSLDKTQLRYTWMGESQSGSLFCFARNAKWRSELYLLRLHRISSHHSGQLVLLHIAIERRHIGLQELIEFLDRRLILRLEPLFLLDHRRGWRIVGSLEQAIQREQLLTNLAGPAQR